MNIAFVNSTHKWGGVKTWMVNFAEQLKLRGNNVYVWGRKQDFVDKCKEKCGHGEVVSFGPDFNPVAISKFIYQFSTKRIQAVIINVGKDLTTAGIAAKILGIPVIQRIGLPRDIPYTQKVDRIHNWVQPWFFCPCDYIREGFVDSLPYVGEEDTKVILNGKICSEHELGLNTPRRLICTSQLNKGKGHEDVLRALAEIDENYECTILGVGNIETELHDLSDSLGLSARVHWAGFTTNVNQQLRKADIFILPSYFEGLPNTLLEAMAQGLLPLCRDVGGIKEVWPEELSDYLLPFDSGPAEFKAAIKKILALPDNDIMELKEKARQACRTRFELTSKAEEFEAWLAQEVIINK